jgi:Flp pilus assembly protein TadD
MTPAPVVLAPLPSGRAFSLLVAALLAIGIALAYGNSFGIGFPFDDDSGIAQNVAIRSLRNIPSFFVDPATYSSDRDAEASDLRPLLFVTYAVNYAVSGLDPWSYHALNLLLHFISSLLVFVIVRDHVWWPGAARGPDGEARVAAAAAALFFALAPLNTQPVNYIWARSALLCVTCYLGAFLAYMRGRWAVGGALLALALLTKVIAITLPALLVIHDLVYRDREQQPSLLSWLKTWRRLAVPVLSAAAVVLAYLAYRILAARFMGVETNLPLSSSALIGAEEQKVFNLASPRVWFMTQWTGLLYYVRLFVWPQPLSVEHGFPLTTSLLEPRAWASLLALLAWAGFAIRAWRPYPQVTFASAWFFVTLAPESSFFSLVQVINDHRPYIASSLGLAVLLAWVLWRCAGWLVPRAAHVAFIAVSLALLIPAIAVDRHRAWIWSDPLRLWEDTAATSPNSDAAAVNAARWLMERGQASDLEKARFHLQRALARSSDLRGMALGMLAMVELREDHTDEALRLAQDAVRIQPDDFRTYTALAETLFKLGRAQDADAVLRRGLERKPPRNPWIRAKLMGALISPTAAEEASAMQAGLDAMYTNQNPASAVEQFRKVLALNPVHYGATYQLAVALDRSGRPEEAGPLWDTVLQLAVAYEDKPTEKTARERLAHKR